MRLYRQKPLLDTPTAIARRARRAANPQKDRDRAAKRRETNYADVLVANAKWQRGRRARLRSEMLEAYGSKCECCGEAERMFLQLDHIDGGGTKERKEFRNVEYLMLDLKKRGWPKEKYRLLCANCNFGRWMNGGTCPHAQ